MFKIQYTTDEDFIGRSRRPAAKTDDIIPIVRDVLVAVRDGGDKAVRELTLKFDKSCPDDLLVSPEELDAAEREVPDDLKKAIAIARENIEKFHRSQLPQKREYVETDIQRSGLLATGQGNRQSGHLHSGRHSTAV